MFDEPETAVSSSRVMLLLISAPHEPESSPVAGSESFRIVV
jgi:hypothetical protein